MYIHKNEKEKNSRVANVGWPAAEQKMLN